MTDLVNTPEKQRLAAVARQVEAKAVISQNRRDKEAGKVPGSIAACVETAIKNMSLVYAANSESQEVLRIVWEDSKRALRGLKELRRVLIEAQDDAEFVEGAFSEGDRVRGALEKALEMVGESYYD